MGQSSSTPSVWASPSTVRFLIETWSAFMYSPSAFAVLIMVISLPSPITLICFARESEPDN